MEVLRVNPASYCNNPQSVSLFVSQAASMCQRAMMLNAAFLKEACLAHICFHYVSHSLWNPH